jgi:hypothetical protein
MFYQGPRPDQAVSYFSVIIIFAQALAINLFAHHKACQCFDSFFATTPRTALCGASLSNFRRINAVYAISYAGDSVKMKNGRIFMVLQT